MTGDGTTDVHQHLHDYIEHKRWFAGKGRGFRVTATRRLAVAAERSCVPCWLVRLGGRLSQAMPEA